MIVFALPAGEAGIDVYGRVTGFMSSMYREHSRPRAKNIVIVSHGLLIRLFLMRWYRWEVDMFDKTDNPPNCGIVVMQRDSLGKFALVEDAGIVNGRFSVYKD